MKHLVTFKFSGSLADDEEEIGGAEHAAYTEAAKRLLSVHAHTYSTGKLPRAGRDHSSEYDVRHKCTQPGCVEDVWSVVIYNPWTLVAAGVIGGAFGQEVRSAVYSFKDFLCDSLAAIANRNPGTLPYIKREPTLGAFGRQNEPFIDAEIENSEVRGELYRLTSRVLLGCAKPVSGRSAKGLSIQCDGSVLLKIDASTLRNLLEQEISTYTNRIRERTQFDFAS